MDPETKTTETGLIVKPDGAREHLFRRGTILRVSDAWVQSKRTGRWRRLPCPMQAGTRVLFPFYYGDKVFERFRAAIGDKDVVLMKPEDILLYDYEEEGRGVDDVTLSVTVEAAEELMGCTSTSS